MENLNKIISLVLGLVVVIILFAIITGRINLKGRNLLKLSSNTKVTPSVSVTPTPKIVKIDDTKETMTYKPYTDKVTTTPAKVISQKNIKTIPSTGPEFLLPMVGSTLLAGLYLRKRS